MFSPLNRPAGCTRISAWSNDFRLAAEPVRPPAATTVDVVTSVVIVGSGFFFPRTLVSMGLATQGDANFATSEGIPLPETD